MLDTVLPAHWAQALALAGLAWVTWNVWVYVTSPLRKYPGPFLAGWTNLWRFYHVLSLDSHHVVEDLHRRHGQVVRIGPNLLSLRDPSLVKKIYKFEDDWVKTAFYHGGSSRSWTGQVTYNIFGVSDRKEHAKIRKPIGKLYNMSNALAMEEHIDRAIELLSNEIEERFIDQPANNDICELDKWLMYFATDVVGDITFSQPFGYLASGTDFDGTLADAEVAMNYLAIVGQIPILDFLGAQNPLLKMLAKAPFTTANSIARSRMEDRLAGKDTATHYATRPDFLDGFIEARKLYPDTVDDGQLQSYLLINLVAGADTTAITMSAIFYLLLKHPDALSRLTSEILDANLSSDRPVSYKKALKLPYLNAVIRESMRLHPAVGMPLERHVPASGLLLPDGSVVPGGAMVGMNPYLVNRTEPFGEQVDQFKPERWLRDADESEAEFKARTAAMNDADLTFGAGTRICGGRHIAYVEMYKVVATLIARYKIELVDQEKEWTVKNGWFLRVSGLDVRFQRR